MTSAHPRDCPGWEYTDHPDYKKLIPSLCDDVLRHLRNNRMLTMSLACETRPSHHAMFERLTPPGYEYFAGNYRGSAYRCLKYYAVGVGADLRVGYPPDGVHAAMGILCDEIRKEMRLLDIVHDLPDAQFDRKSRLLSVVLIACKILEKFLTIHPYANGNGHMGRLVVWTIFWRYNYWPRGWPLDRSPKYSALLSQYRDGMREPLEHFVLSCL